MTRGLPVVLPLHSAAARGLVRVVASAGVARLEGDQTIPGTIPFAANESHLSRCRGKTNAPD